MAKYVFVYQGGGGMPETPEEGEKVMAAWMNWFGQLGEAVIDGGNPFGASTTVGGGNGAALTGYSIVDAADLNAAADMARGCPILGNGGSVGVYEAVAM
jgi:hypothetical protein